MIPIMRHRKALQWNRPVSVSMSRTRSGHKSWSLSGPHAIARTQSKLETRDGLLRARSLSWLWR